MDKSKITGDSFPLDALPKRIQNVIKHFEDAEQYDRNASALTILTHSASLLRSDVLANYKGTRIQRAILWGAFIQESGTGKSYTLNTFTKFLSEQDALLNEVNAEYRHKVNTATIEGLVKNHVDNCRGTFLSLDELTAWIEGFKSYGATGVLKRYLELYYGFEETHIRKGASPIAIPHTKVNIISGIQPKAISEAFTQDDFIIGWIQRFLFTEMYSNEIRLEKDSEVDKRHLEGMQMINSNLWNINANIFPYKQEARSTYIKWYNDLLTKWNPYYNYRTYVSKLNVYSSRIALVLHCLKAKMQMQPEAFISKETIEETIQILEFFFRQYEKVVEKVTNQEFKDVNLEHLEKKNPKFQKQYAKLTLKRYSNKELVEHFTGSYQTRHLQSIIKDKRLFEPNGNGYTKKVTDE